jgi:hypothetical protein
MRRYTRTIRLILPVLIILVRFVVLCDLILILVPLFLLLFSYTFLIAEPIKSTDIGTDPEGFEPSTNCSAGSHSIQAELWIHAILTRHHKPYMKYLDYDLMLGKSMVLAILN